MMIQFLMIQYYRCPTWPSVIYTHFPGQDHKKTGKNVENELKVGYKIQPDTILQYPGHSSLPILPGKEIADWDCGLQTGKSMK